MKYILLVMLPLMVVCISCKGKAAQTESNDVLTDSIMEADVCRSFNFLGNLGIEYESLIAQGDTLPTPSANDCLLAQKHQDALLNGVITNISDSTSAYLVSVRQINDSIALCQYRHNLRDSEAVYIATYNTGTLIDAIFAGGCWNRSGVLSNLSDSTELIYKDRTYIDFIGDNEFALSRAHKEIEHNVNTGKDSTTYIKTISNIYNIDSDGKLIITLPEADVYEEGIFRIWNGLGAKNEWDRMDDVLTLSMYPYSDEKVLVQWDVLGNKVDGALAELFESRFFEYVFVPCSEKVLRWIYDNSDSKSQNLAMVLEFEYANSPQNRQIIEAAIARLDNPDMRTFFNEMLYSHKEG